MNRKRGFTLVELLVVVAIIAVLAGILTPIIIGQVTKAQSAACISSITEIKRMYVLEQVEAEIDGETDMNKVLAKTFTNHFSIEAAEGQTVFGGICPTGGVYTCSIDAYGGLSVSCSKHGGLGSSSGYDLIIQLQQMSSDWTSYFTNKANGSALDSSATHSWAAAPKIMAQLETKLGVSLKGNAWKIIKTGSSSYDIYWTTEDINSLDSGSTVTVSRYNSAKDTYETGTVKIVHDSQTYNGETSSYNKIDAGSYKKS